MKLATYRDGSRDGQLVIVSGDLAHACYASGVADTLQRVLDDWNFLAPQLQELSRALDGGQARNAFAFDPARCMAPLPRIHGCFEIVSARPGHDHELHAFGGALPGPRDPILLPAQDDALSAEAAIAAVLGSVPCAPSPERGLDAVRLLMLACRFTVHAGAGDAQARPLTARQARMATALGPVAVTPDEVGADWQDGRLRLALQLEGGASVEGNESVQQVPVGASVAQAARTHALGPGTVLIGPFAANAPRTSGLRVGDSVTLGVQGHGLRATFGVLQHPVQWQGRA